MPSINDMLNKISDFKCVVDSNEIVFPAILQEKNWNVILECKKRILFSRFDKDTEVIMEYSKKK